MIKRFQTSVLNLFRSRKVFWVLYVSIILLWTIEAFYRLYFLDFCASDLACQLQPVANLVFNNHFYYSIEDMHPFANHFRPGLLFFAPLIKIIPSAIWIMLVRIISYSLVPLIFLKMGKKYLSDQRYIYTVPVLWLINDVVTSIMFAQNFATSILFPVFVLSFYFAYENKHFRMYICLFFILLFKESMPLVWLSVGMFKIVEQKQWKHGIFLIITGVFIGLGLHLFIMPLFNAGMVSKHQSMLGVFYDNIPLKISMMFKIILALGCIPLIYPKSFLYTMPAFSLYLVSNIMSALFVRAHYHDFTISIMFVAVFFALKYYLKGNTWFNKVGILKQKKQISIILGLLLLLSFFKLPIKTIINPVFKNRSYVELYKMTKAVKDLNNYLSLHKEIDVYASQKTATYLFTHPRLRSIPTRGSLPKYFSKGITDNKYIVVFPENPNYFHVNKNNKQVIINDVKNGLISGKYKEVSGYYGLTVVLCEGE